MSIKRLSFIYSQNASRKREEKYLRLQLEQQKKAYEEMKRQMKILQSAQSDAPGEGRIVAGNSGYADFPDMNQGSNPPTQPPPATSQASTSPSIVESPTSPDRPLLSSASVAATPYADLNGEGHVVATGDEGEKKVLLDVAEGEKAEVLVNQAASPYLVSVGLVNDSCGH